MTFGLDFGLKDSIEKLGSITAELRSVADELRGVEQDGRKAGDGIADGMEDAAGSAEGLGKEVDGAADKIKGIGEETEKAKTKVLSATEEMGARFQESMGSSLKSGESFWKSFKSGIGSSFGYAGEQAKAFFDDSDKKLKKYQKAWQHPIDAIKSKLGKAMLDAAKDTRKVEDAAEDTETKLDDAGDEGESAGNQIGDAIKGAIGAFVGFEAIQAGIDMLKELGAAALELAGVAENTGKKFDANFTEEDAQWAENFGSSIHRAKSEVESFMVSNKALYGEMGITGEAATELSKATTSLAYDFGNAFSMDDTEALGVVQDYISGNSAALEEYGIHIDDTILKNTAMAMGLGSNIEELDEAAQAQVRMNALLQESGNIQQAAIKDTGGLTNSTKSLKGIWNEFMADAGSKFAPVMENLFGTILDNWPTIEPMLMGFVDVLSNGFSQAVPVLLDLGQTLIPTLTSVLGTLFEAGTPIISVFGELAQSILPPFAEIIGTIGSSLLPPLTSILSSLNENVIQPLMPVLQSIAEALLPPIATLLEAITPLLDLLKPPLEFSGEMISAIAAGLGEMINFIAGGIGDVVDFFSGFFGGADESKEAVDELGSSMKELGEIPDAEISIGTKADVSGSKEIIEQQDAMTLGSQKTQEEIAADQEEIAKGLKALSDQADLTYSHMGEKSTALWKQMQEEAAVGSQAIISSLRSINSSANVAVSFNVPHNAKGTDSFEGGLTYMNEEGGELALLPSGTAIIPADRSEQLIDGIVTNNANDNRTWAFSPNVVIQVTSDADMSVVEKIEEKLRELFPELYKEMQEADYANRALQAGYA